MLQNIHQKEKALLVRLKAPHAMAQDAAQRADNLQIARVPRVQALSRLTLTTTITILATVGGGGGVTGSVGAAAFLLLDLVDAAVLVARCLLRLALLLVGCWRRWFNLFKILNFFELFRNQPY